MEVFDTSLVPHEGLYWAGNHSELKARQLEELALWDQLTTAPWDGRKDVVHGAIAANLQCFGLGIGVMTLVWVRRGLW